MQLILQNALDEFDSFYLVANPTVEFFQLGGSQRIVKAQVTVLSQPMTLYLACGS
jgi:hypothetical protein